MQTPQQLQDCGALSDAGPSTDNDDDPAVSMVPRQLQEIVTVARDEHTTFVGHVAQDVLVRRIGRQIIAQESDVVPRPDQRAPDRVRHIVIEKELHRYPVGSAIC